MSLTMTTSTPGKSDSERCDVNGMSQQLLSTNWSSTKSAVHVETRLFIICSCWIRVLTLLIVVYIYAVSCPHFSLVGLNYFSEKIKLFISVCQDHVNVLNLKSKATPLKFFTAVSTYGPCSRMSLRKSTRGNRIKSRLTNDNYFEVTNDTFYTIFLSRCDSTELRRDYKSNTGATGK